MGKGGVAKPEEIAIEELVNPHRHRIPLPKAGTAVELELEYDPQLSLVKVYGYEPEFSEGRLRLRRRLRLRLRLDDLNHGATQVAMLQFRVLEEGLSKRHLRVRATLSYYDVERDKHVVKQQNSHVTVQGGRGQFLRDDEVRKNYTIARMAQALKTVAAQWQACRYREAERIAARAEHRVREFYPSGDDPDILRNLKILQKTLRIIRLR